MISLNENRKLEVALLLIVLLLAGVVQFSGCETHRHTVRSTTTEPTTGTTQTTTTTTSSTTETEPASGATVVEEKTTTSEPRTGILGGALHVVGQILAFPFKVVAGLFEAIF